MKTQFFLGALTCILLCSAALSGCGGGASEPKTATATPGAAEGDESIPVESGPSPSQSDQGTTGTENSTVKDPEALDEEAEADPEPDGIGESSAPPQPAIAVPEGVSLIACPDPQATLMLKFSANIEISTQEAVITHVLHDGVLFLNVVPGEDGTVGITTSVGEPIAYEMNGTMGDCALEGGGTMSPSATGYCQDGVVYLTIIEDWSPYRGTLTCPDTQIPMSAPSMGQQTHSGADNRGEIFFLDANFSEEGAGYTTIRPFAGPMGQGEHIWTLFYEYTGPVGL